MNSKKKGKGKRFQVTLWDTQLLLSDIFALSASLAMSVALIDSRKHVFRSTHTGVWALTGDIVEIFLAFFVPPMILK